MSELSLACCTLRMCILLPARPPAPLQALSQALDPMQEGGEARQRGGLEGLRDLLLSVAEDAGVGEAPAAGAAEGQQQQQTTKQQQRAGV